jgi:hypothetical protein
MFDEALAAVECPSESCWSHLPPQSPHRRAEARGIIQSIASLQVCERLPGAVPRISRSTASIWIAHHRELLCYGRCSIVGLMGETFASRVSASILTAAGLPELVTTSLEDYHALALRLARDAAAIGALKAKIADARNSSALFNTAQFARDLEQALVAMSERNRAGLPPDHIAIE